MAASESLDLVRARHRSATIEFHLQRALHDLANHFHAIELRVTFLESERRGSPDSPAVLNEVLHSCASARQRIDALKRELPPPVGPSERVALPPILAQAAALALRDGGEVAIAPEVEALPAVRGVEPELSTVFVHLFDNAREANGRVRVEGAVDGEQVVLRVSDDGAGVADELRAKIWKPFFTTKGPEHHGHGLALAQQLLRRAGGEIELQPGQPGARFVLRLAR